MRRSSSEGGCGGRPVRYPPSTFFRLGSFLVSFTLAAVIMQALPGPQYEQPNSVKYMGEISRQDTRVQQSMMGTMYNATDTSSHLNVSYGDVIVVQSIARVCKSSGLSQLVASMAKRNNYKSQQIKQAGRTALSLHEESSVVEEITATGTVPTLYEFDGRFINFTRYNKSSPSFISLLTDPIEKAVKRYYEQNKGLGRVIAGRTNVSFDQCVAVSDGFCTAPGNLNTYVPYFCGNHEICSSVLPGDQDKALSQALHNIEKSYLLIGLVGEMDRFYKLAMKLAPRFFEGSSGYHSYSKKLLKKQPSYRKPLNITGLISDSTRHVMSQLMNNDYVIYKHVKQTFNNLYDKHVKLTS